MSKDLGSRELLAKAEEVFWYPSEVDVSIRPGLYMRSMLPVMQSYQQKIAVKC